MNAILNATVKSIEVISPFTIIPNIDNRHSWGNTEAIDLRLKDRRNAELEIIVKCKKCKESQCVTMSVKTILALQFSEHARIPQGDNEKLHYTTYLQAAFTFASMTFYDALKENKLEPEHLPIKTTMELLQTIRKKFPEF